MINKEELNQALEELAEKRQVLNQLDYNDDKYDDAEDVLHDLEDAFNEKYGTFLEQIIHDVHDELCPDSDVLLPTAYLAKNFNQEGKMDDGDVIFALKENDGVYVDVDDYSEKDTRLVLLPSPARLWLLVDGEPREEVWNLNT